MKKLIFKGTGELAGIPMHYYESGFYFVQIYQKDEGPTIQLIAADYKHKYLPRISQSVDFFNPYPELEISTTSYGDLLTDDIQSMIEGYQIALETVEQINDLINNLYN